MARFRYHPLPVPLRGRPEAGLGYWFFTLHVLTVFGIALSNAFLGATLLWLGWIWSRGGETRARRLHLPLLTRSGERHGFTGTTLLLLPLALYVLFFLVSVATSYDPSASLYEVRDVLTLLTLPLALLLVAGELDVRRIQVLLVDVTAALATYGILQYVFTDYGDLHSRIPGPFSHYMTFSGVLLVGECLLLGRMAVRDEWRRSGNWVRFTLITVALALTLTRSAWVAALLVITVLLLVRARRWFPLYAAALIATGVLLAILAPGVWGRFESIFDPEDPSNYDRLCMANAGLHMVTERPLYGLGPAMVAERYPLYRHPTAPRSHVKHLHSTYIQLAAERGLLSLVAYLWLVLAGAFCAWKSYRVEGGPRGPTADLHLGVLLVLLAFSVAGVFEANWRDTEVQRLVLFVLAMPLCLDRGARMTRAGDVGGGEP